MRAWQTLGLGIVGALGLPVPAAVAMVIVTYEKPGAQSSGAAFSFVGVEGFESVKPGKGKNFSTDFGTGGVIKGRYTGLQVDRANQYGSAGGSGNHAVVFSNAGYTLDLETRLDGGVTYFGYWLSALDSRNVVTLWSGGKEMFAFTPTAVLGAIGGEAAYFGNPNSSFAGQNKREPYAFVNFFSDFAIDQVRFTQRSGGGGYESDNHSVGQWIGQSGAMVPEPTTWVMLISGFGLVGWALRRKRALETA